MKSFIRPILFLFTTAVLLHGCSTDSDPDPIIIDNRPVTKGIYITGETSSDAIATWGSPELPSSELSNTTGYEMRNIYPNPADGTMRIELRVPKDISVRIWLERARWENEEEIEFETPFIETITTQEFQEGTHLIELNNGFNCGNNNDRNLEEGFYRVYVETNEFYFWRDIYITGYLENTPNGLEQYTNEFCQ